MREKQPSGVLKDSHLKHFGKYEILMFLGIHFSIPDVTKVRDIRKEF